MRLELDEAGKNLLIIFTLGSHCATRLPPEDLLLSSSLDPFGFALLRPSHRDVAEIDG
jgi:hypothetical protein